MSTGHDADRIHLTAKDVAVILTPYAWGKIREQLVCVLPIVVYLFLFQWLILGQPIESALSISGGIALVILGLAFFMEGLRLGLIPFGEAIGSTLPVKSTLFVVLLFAFLVGIGATLAEPAIGTLKAAGKLIEAEKAPLLYDLLNNRSGALVWAVGIGVGLAAALGILRFLLRWSLKVLIFPAVLATMGLTIAAMLDPKTAAVLGLAWDCGAVTTGPVTVPIVLALGIGVSRITTKGRTGMAGFGIVTVASIFPILAVIALSLIIYHGGFFDEQAVIAAAGAEAAAAEPGFADHPVVVSVLAAVQAIIPLFLFLYLFQRLVLREDVRQKDEIFLGIGFCVLGMALFNLGLTYGLSALGEQIGTKVPDAYHPPGEGIYGYTIGIIVAIGFGALMGYGATLAEPALNALGMTVEQITIGAFKKSLLMHAVALGVAVGIGTGVMKFIFDFPLVYVLLPSYVVALVMTAMADEKYVNIGWDSAGVTTGPVTVPLVIAMGLGIGQTAGLVEGFGILSLASIGPILTVLLLGLIVSRGERALERE